MKFLRLADVIFISGIIFLSAVSGQSQVANGKDAPVFNLRNVKGELVKPFQEPKPVIISFFFTDCPKCRLEIKELESLNQKFGDKVKIVLVGTSFKKDVDVTDDVKTFIEELGVSFVPLVDKYKDVIQSYQVSTYPALYLINSQGQVVFSSSAYNEKTIENLEKQLKSVK